MVFLGRWKSWEGEQIERLNGAKCKKYVQKSVCDSSTKGKKCIKNYVLEYVFSLEGVALVSMFCKIILLALTNQMSKYVSS